MKYLHDCPVLEREILSAMPNNATMMTHTWKCPECKQRWWVRLHRGGATAVRHWPRRYLKVKR